MSECSHDFDSNELSNYCAKGCRETWALYTIKNLQKENAILREALKFYADRNNWIRSYVFNIDKEALEPSGWADKLKTQDCALLNCGGGRARLALSHSNESRKYEKREL